MPRSRLTLSQLGFLALCLFMAVPHGHAFVHHSASLFRGHVGHVCATEDTDDGTVLGSKYVLSTNGGEQSTSGKSTLVEAKPWQQQQDQQLQQQQVPPHNGGGYNFHNFHPQTATPPAEEEKEAERKRVVVKFSENIKALKREVKNYQKLTNDDTKDLFVEIHDFYNPQAGQTQGQHMSASLPPPGADAPQFKGQAALVMERGAQDLQSYLQEHGPLQGAALQEAVATTARTVQACHDQGMVWTELKAPNFVVTSTDHHHGTTTPISIKAIDLESAVPQGSPPVDFSPEAIPPEFALAYMCGREPYMEIQPSFDIFSLGLLWYEMATGRKYWQHYFHQPVEEPPCPVSIAQAVRNQQEGTMPVPVGGSSSTPMEAAVQELISRCLKVNPQDRPAVHELLHHPYIAQVVQ